MSKGKDDLNNKKEGENQPRLYPNNSPNFNYYPSSPEHTTNAPFAYSPCNYISYLLNIDGNVQTITQMIQATAVTTAAYSLGQFIGFMKENGMLSLGGSQMHKSKHIEDNIIKIEDDDDTEATNPLCPNKPTEIKAPISIEENKINLAQITHVNRQIGEDNPNNKNIEGLRERIAYVDIEVKREEKKESKIMEILFSSSQGNSRKGPEGEKMRPREEKGVRKLRNKRMCPEDHIIDPVLSIVIADYYSTFHRLKAAILEYEMKSHFKLRNSRSFHNICYTCRTHASCSFKLKYILKIPINMQLRGEMQLPQNIHQIWIIDKEESNLVHSNILSIITRNTKSRKLK